MPNSLVGTYRTILNNSIDIFLVVFPKGRWESIFKEIISRANKSVRGKGHYHVVLVKIEVDIMFWEGNLYLLSDSTSRDQIISQVLRVYVQRYLLQHYG